MTPHKRAAVEVAEAEERRPVNVSYYIDDYDNDKV